MLGKTRNAYKWVVYRGSVHTYRDEEEKLIWLMTEEEWQDRYKKDDIGSAVVLARGLDYEVAVKMANLSREN